MISLQSRSLLAAALLVAGTAPSPAATVQFTLTNVAPTSSLGIDPVLFLANLQDLSDVIFTSNSTDMEILPQLTWQISADAAGAPFPPPGSSASLPFLQPGDRVSFTLNNVNFLSENTLHYGVDLFGTAPIADAGGNFRGTSLTLTAGSLGAFDTAGAGAPRLVIPGSPEPGPASISSSTPVLQLTVVPEPSALLLIAAGFGVALGSRCRYPLSGI